MTVPAGAKTRWNMSPAMRATVQQFLERESSIAPEARDRLLRTLADTLRRDEPEEAKYPDDHDLLRHAAAAEAGWPDEPGPSAASSPRRPRPSEEGVSRIASDLPLRPGGAVRHSAQLWRPSRESVTLLASLFALWGSARVGEGLATPARPNGGVLALVEAIALFAWLLVTGRVGASELPAATSEREARVLHALLFAAAIIALASL